MLSRLLAETPGAEVRGDPDVLVDDLAYDSRDVPDSSLFFCVSGARSDGHLHAPEAVRSGASALVVERWLDVAATQVRVDSVRAAMGPLSAAFFEHPSRSLPIVGVTGTNGKTTTSFMLERAFEAAGIKAGLIGTIVTRVAGEVLPVTRTTPEAPDLQRLLARMRASGVGGVAMEVSSHGLALRRIDSTRFACAVFTNLTQDHLDFHGTMEDYFAAKALLFSGGLAERAAVNADDPHGRSLLASSGLPAVSFALDSHADVRAIDVDVRRDGSVFTIAVGERLFPGRTRIAGRFNVSNALATVAAFQALGLPVGAALEGVGALDRVPGRMEPVDAGQGFTVIVDYAHTPDSLANVLRLAREMVAPGAALACVFGCGGDRDRGKRAVMGRIAASLADRIAITSDNPRSEDPGAIIAAIESGAREAAGSPYTVEPDRREAIRLAIAASRPGDVVVIAGKGHETGQEFADRTVPFDDRVVAREILEEVGGR
ncbi:MAG: UDP-N-acetylmuramoyl-L-alanyl-D-glutamate--2,6-diaminopimelate ligase [Acidobacteria bacterium]|nr:UDP-N-acetylmuramoyl-L-alanyl-D-glutamate--2,6-diaminopimelate ligase [Acidobacteriota bacterium]